MDFSELGVRLAALAVKNTASEISNKIKQTKASNDDKETIGVLEEIINDLTSDKNELKLIAQAYEEEFVTQKISDNEIDYIINNLIPVVRELLYKTAKMNDQQVEEVEEIMGILEPLLSTETLNVLQLLGLNFKKAIGEPLTRLISSAIDSNQFDNPTDKLELQKLNERKQIEFYKMINNEKAYERFKESNLG